ncbi:DNA topoisomerase III [Anaerosporobacter faecicola]|uniref:DNA topoisomerase III n=1 Tax=Anaerosporobacter faecicola TaxID=2718714 RepID=UPI00143C9BFC|nr:DNA topoisomerase III [Anaerosporobacter faecicola]
MKTVVIAEKPSVARDIARVLHCNQKINGALEGKQYIVTWGLGHLVTLADPEKYKPEYKEWKMEHLPMLPDRMELVVIKQTAKQFQAVKTQIFRKDVGDIIIATDAGREGELVARWIIEKAGCKKPMKRLWISSVTDKAIKDGFAHLKSSKEYDALYDAAVARAESDWLVGMNATRALTCKYNAQLSCGRVQTPTLAMIAKREEEIRKFQPQSYYGLHAKANGVSFTWKDRKTNNTTSFDKDRMMNILKKVQNQKGTATILQVKKTSKKTFAPALYDLTELQRDANKRFHFSAKETLNIMQRLYENHKVLTYPRTDSRYITTDVVATIPERLRACAVGPYKKLAGRLANTSIKGNGSFVNNNKVSDHHAIIPTEQFVQLDHMTNEEKKIYDLVVRRFLAVLYPPFEYEETTVEFELAGELFVTKAKVVTKLGFQEVYVADQEENYMDFDDEETESNLKGQFVRNEKVQTWKAGDQIEGVLVTISEGKTKPPAYFTEATLLSAMENPVKYMEHYEKEAAKTLGETGGLGTVATRADIIEKLFSNFLIEKKGNEIFITSKGKQLLTLVPAPLKKPELTADWETKLGQIAKGTMKKATFMKDIRSYSMELVEEIKGGEGTYRHDNLTNSKCPVCGKRMLSVKGKNSRMLVCQDRSCGYRETIARTTNARCPVCHKKMELCGKDDASVFVCACGHKEKLSAFQERRKKEGAGVSKKEVANYLKKQQKEANEPVNNAFADAFAKLKL